MKIMKIINVEKVIITSPFGKRIHPITKEIRFHNGIDIQCPIGTEVRSPEIAVVEFIKTNSATAGIYIVLRSISSGDRYDFMHLSKVLCRKGDLVGAGQPIALSGATGRVTGPHLHFSRAINCTWNNCGLTVTQTYVDPSDKIDI